MMTGRPMGNSTGRRQLAQQLRDAVDRLEFNRAVLLDAAKLLGERRSRRICKKFSEIKILVGPVVRPCYFPQDINFLPGCRNETNADEKHSPPRRLARAGDCSGTSLSFRGSNLRLDRRIRGDAFLCAFRPTHESASFYTKS